MQLNDAYSASRRGLRVPWPARCWDARSTISESGLRPRPGRSRKPSCRRRSSPPRHL
jgi:hypothetical protein